MHSAPSRPREPRVSRLTPAEKPLLRGVSHQLAAGFALLAGIFLFTRAPSGAPSVAVATYTLSLTALLAISATYHRVRWSPRPRVWMQRLDHSAIFLLIAGTYTPLSLGLPPGQGALLRWIVWSGAAVGVCQALLWVTAPKPFIATVYVVLGWSVLPFVRQMYATVGAGPLALLLGGGVIYSVGAVVYARRRPDPLPTVFGYHEVFHALVLVAATIHYFAVARVVLRS